MMNQWYILYDDGYTPGPYGIVVTAATVVEAMEEAKRHGVDPDTVFAVGLTDALVLATSWFGQACRVLRKAEPPKGKD